MGVLCPNHNSFHCHPLLPCDANYVYHNSQCVSEDLANTCTCDNGMPHSMRADSLTYKAASPYSCGSPETHICTTCLFDDAYHLSSEGRCVHENCIWQTQKEFGVYIGCGVGYHMAGMCASGGSKACNGPGGQLELKNTASEKF